MQYNFPPLLAPNDLPTLRLQLRLQILLVLIDHAALSVLLLRERVQALHEPTDRCGSPEHLTQRRLLKLLHLPLTVLGDLPLDLCSVVVEVLLLEAVELLGLSAALVNVRRRGAGTTRGGGGGDGGGSGRRVGEEGGEGPARRRQRRRSRRGVLVLIVGCESPLTLGRRRPVPVLDLSALSLDPGVLLAHILVLVGLEDRTNVLGGIDTDG